MMEKIIAMLKKMSDDVEYYVRELDEEKPELVITVEDFEGFDDDWSEKMRDYDVEAVNGLIKWLLDQIIKAIPTVTQLIYDFLKEKVENL